MANIISMVGTEVINAAIGFGAEEHVQISRRHTDHRRREQGYRKPSPAHLQDREFL
jgi:hypothetical protein